MLEKQNRIQDTRDVDQVIRRELLKSGDRTVEIQKGKDYERIEVSQDLQEVPDPRILGTKIIFDSRLDQYSQSDDVQEKLSALGSQPHYPKLTLQDKKEALFGKKEIAEIDEFGEEPSKPSFRKKNDAEADIGIAEIKDERIRLIQQKLINFKRILVGTGIPPDFCDYLILKFSKFIEDSETTDKQIEEFCKYLKENIKRLRFEATKESVLSSITNIASVDLLCTISKNNENLERARKTLGPQHANMKEFVHHVIELGLEKLIKKLDSTLHRKFQTNIMHVKVNDLQRGLLEYEAKRKSRTKPDLMQ